MADPSRTCSDLEEWVEKAFLNQYRSCIRINGLHILPPLMTLHRRAEMRLLREKALKVESRLSRKRLTDISADSAGGEALYENCGDELNFANSLPCSLSAQAERQPHHSAESESSDTELKTTEQSMEMSKSARISHDMLREFDPLAPDEDEVVGDLPVTCFSNANDGQVKKVYAHELSGSKPSSAESSATLSNSTDLNQYLDLTECSTDLSAVRMDTKSDSEFRTATPSTLRLNSAECHSSSRSSPLDKTTYENLNQYLDKILNNQDDSSMYQCIRDENLNSIEISGGSVEQGSESERCDNEELLQEWMPQNKYSPPPLTEPPDSLKTRLLPKQSILKTPVKCNQIRNSSNFLDDCALSPVMRDQALNAYEKRIHMYLQNMMVDDTTVNESCLSSSVPQKAHQDYTQSPGCSSAADGKLSRSRLSLDSHQNMNTEASLVNEGPPRLVRSNSYTLDSPSPLLLAHMEAELRKNCSNKSIADKQRLQPRERAQSALCGGRSRRVWDIEKAKNSAYLFSKQSSLSNNQMKKENKTRTPRKVQVRSKVFHASPLKGVEPVSTANVVTQASSVEVETPKSPGNNSKKISTKQPLQENPMADDRQASLNASPTTDSGKEKLSLLLTKLQLQHSREMEALLTRQRKEQEAIRVVLLNEQALFASKSTSTSTEYTVTASLDNIDTKAESLKDTNILKSPSSKDQNLVIERRNTSPSIYQHENADELQKCLLQYNKSSSISMDNVSLGSEPNNILESDHDTVFSDQVIYLSDNESNEVSSDMPSNMHSAFSRPQSNFSSQNLDGTAVNSQTTVLPTSNSFAHGSLCGPNTSSSISFNMISSFPLSQLCGDVLQNSITDSFPSNQRSSLNQQYKALDNTVSVALPLSVLQISQVRSSWQPGLTKRKSWCSRQLFSDNMNNCEEQNLDWMTVSVQLQKNAAAARIQAGVRGYLTRRLLKTERVQNCITTIRDTIVCALQLQKECAPRVEQSDLQLHGRLIQQLSAACEELHTIFLGLPILKRMAIISADREWLRSRSSRSSSSAGSRPLSRATQIALQRKLNQSDPLETGSSHSTSSSHRNRRRSWASMDTRSRLPLVSASAAATALSCSEIVAGCLSRSFPSGQTSPGSSRRPWR